MKRVPPPIRRGDRAANGWVPESEADHFVQCPGCGAWVDMRDLGMVLDHARPLRHPVRQGAVRIVERDRIVGKWRPWFQGPLYQRTVTRARNSILGQLRWIALSAR